jgi:hypothetical protein
MNDGKHDLDAHRWSAAVNNFARAKASWKARGSPNWRFADTLQKDVLRSHPVSGKVEKAGDSQKPVAGGAPLGRHAKQVFSFFFITLDTGPRRPLSLELSDTKGKVEKAGDSQKPVAGDGMHGAPLGRHAKQVLLLPLVVILFIRVLRWS